MWLKVDDGRVVFATHVVRLKVSDSCLSKLRCELAGCYQTEQDCLIAYDYDEAREIAEELKMRGVENFVVEPVQVPADFTGKVNGVRYASRSEALAHLLEDKEPESLVVENLRRKLKEKDLVINQIMGELQALKSSLQKKGVLS